MKVPQERLESCQRWLQQSLFRNQLKSSQNGISGTRSGTEQPMYLERTEAK